MLVPICWNPSVVKESSELKEDCSITMFFVSIVIGSPVSVVNSFMTIFTSASSPSKSVEIFKGVVPVILDGATGALVSDSIVVVEAVPTIFKVVFL